MHTKFPMDMTIFRFITIMIASLSMAMAFSHLLPLPARMSFGSPTWITTRRMFALYGSVGAFIEMGAVLFAAILAYLLPQRRPAFRWTLAGAICLVAALRRIARSRSGCEGAIDNTSTLTKAERLLWQENCGRKAKYQYTTRHIGEHAQAGWSKIVVRNISRNI